jgi:hypothetical protein
VRSYLPPRPRTSSQATAPPTIPIDQVR